MTAPSPAGPPPVTFERPAGVRPMGFPAEDPGRDWPFWLAPLGMVLAFAAVLAGSVVVLLIGSIVGADGLAKDEVLLTLLQDALWIVVAATTPLLIVRWVRPEHLGLRGRPLGRSLLKLVVVVVLFYLLAALYSSALGLTDQDNALLEDTGFGDSALKDVAYALLYTVGAPVAEELLFRGILFGGLRDGLRRRWGRGRAVGVAALVSGVIFGGIHVGNGQNDFLPVLMVLGVLLALAYEWSGTIYVPIAIHALNNAIATGSSADPVGDWVYALIAAGPVLALLLALLVGRLIRRLPSEPPPPERFAMPTMDGREPEPR